jgi:2-hydroxy-3-oxopropionate reductase
MVGGAEETVDEALPLLQTMGRVTRIGPVGTGQLAKLANQTIVGITIGAVAEALVLAEAGGANPSAVRQALLGGFADSTILRQHGERMLNRDFKPGGHATTQLKDLTTALAAIESTGGSYPLLSLCAELYEELCRSDRAD